MATTDKVRVQRAPGSTEVGISLSTLSSHLGSQAAQEILSRVDNSQLQGTTIIGTSVRDARVGISRAKTEGHVQFVVPGRSGSKGKVAISLSDGLVIINMVDLAAVVRAGRGEFDWAKTFSPRGGLNAATTSPILQRGSRGRHLLRA